MKTNLQKILLAIVFLFSGMCASAYDFEVDGIYYNITSDADKTVEVTYYNNEYDSYSGDIELPSTIIVDDVVYNVTSIGLFAFRECTSLTSVTIPSGIIKIDKGAFMRCTKLYNLTLPESIVSIGSEAFQYSGIRTINIPEGVSSIGSYAFQYSSIRSITLPTSIKKIEGRTFDYSNLSSIVIPSSVTEIADGAFGYCGNLTSIEIPSSVKKIGDYAFEYCQGLKEIRLLATTPPYIYTYTFSGVLSMKPTLYVPYGCKEDYQSANYWCNFDYIVEDEPEVVIPEIGSKFVYEGFFFVITVEGREVSITYKDPLMNNVPIRKASETEYTGDIIIPSAVVYEDITYDVTGIDDKTFAGNTSLISVTIPKSVTSIGNNVFDGCTSLTEVHLESTTPPNINESTFEGMSDATTIYVPIDALENYENDTTWNNVSNLTEEIEWVELHLQNSYYNTAIFYLEKGSKQRIKIVSTDAHFVLNTVLYNDVDVTDELVDGVYTTPAIESNSVLNISYTIPTAQNAPLHDSRIKAYGQNGHIVVNGCESGESIAIYDTDGKLLRTQYATGRSERIEMPGDAIYVVKVENTAVKVAL